MENVRAFFGEGLISVTDGEKGQKSFASLEGELVESGKVIER